MPSSTDAGKAMIGKLINGLITSDSFRILDLGCGKGTYGKLITRSCEKVAVDAVDYRNKFDLLSVYDKFVNSDIRDEGRIRALGKFDLVIMGDVLEHLVFRDARKVLDFLEDMSDCIIVAVPYLYPQDGRNNSWETHRQPELTRSLFLERYPEFKLIKEYNRAGRPFYGYFVWRLENGENS